MPGLKKLVIIGAGPMGLFAALQAIRQNLDVTVLERDVMGHSLLSWGKTRFFSPLEMNIPGWLREILPELPAGDSLLTGEEMVTRVLLPISRLPEMKNVIRLGHRVVSVGRAGLTRKDFPDHPIRYEKPFRILVSAAKEYFLEADLIFDATGAYALTNSFGPGGLPVAGLQGSNIPVFQRLGDLDTWVENFADTFSESRILLIGHGHSAAHALLTMRAAAHRNPNVFVTWVFRSRNTRPFRETPHDPLLGRAAVISEANSMAASPPPFLDVRRGCHVLGMDKSEGRLTVNFSMGRPVAIDAVASFTGYRPDLSFLSELALDLSPATQGTRRLHGILTGATDCLSVPVPQIGDLASGEPGFYLLGAKSYGRASTFLLRDGIAQMEMIFKHAFD